MSDGSTRQRVRARAPVRALDAGGWTDTWFASEGVVCNLAMDDGADVVVEWDEGDDGPATVELSVPAYDHRYRFALARLPGRHPLLEAALLRWAPRTGHVTVSVSSAVPPGAGLGTSACVVVALIAALRTATGSPIDSAELARQAHAIETVDLGLQSGVQDQIAAARGGCNFITIGPYPHAEVESLDLSAATWDALASRTVTAYLNAPHRSAVVHDMVIERLTTTDSEPLLSPLRAAARDAAAALLAGDLDAYGAAMIANTDAQAVLHPGLVSEHARDVITLARRCRATGWKVNGAGGDGGTVTIVAAEDPGEILHVLATTPGVTILPLRPARHGVRITA